MPAAKKKAASKPKRTTHRSVSGTKLYAVRDSKGRFKDIQTYKRAQAADMRKKSKPEEKAAVAKAMAPAKTARKKKPAAPVMDSPVSEPPAP